MNYDLERFITAQAPVYEAVRSELSAGRKVTHWMWFVFPQLVELGRSGTARRYGLDGLEEAQAYWEHPLLGSRLAVCTGLALASGETDAHRLFGSPDDLKFRSCMTLFSEVPGTAAVFERALQHFYGGEPDPLTLDALRTRSRIK